MAQLNQFTKADAEGLERPESSNQFIAGTRKEHPEEVREKIRMSHLVQILDDIASDPKVKPADRAAAAKVLLDKSLASLTSLDMSVRDDREATSPEMLKAKLAALVEKCGPALLSEILGERARQLAQSPVIEGELVEDQTAQGSK